MPPVDEMQRRYLARKTRFVVRLRTSKVVRQLPLLRSHRLSAFTARVLLMLHDHCHPLVEAGNIYPDKPRQFVSWCHNIRIRLQMFASTKLCRRKHCDSRTNSIIASRIANMSRDHATDHVQQSGKLDEFVLIQLGCCDRGISGLDNKKCHVPRM